VGYQDNFNKIADATLSAFGVPVTYTPAGGTPKDIRAVVQPKIDLDDKQWLTALEAVAVCLVGSADVVKPAGKDAILVGSETWTVNKILGRSGDLWKLELSRDLRPTFKHR